MILIAEFDDGRRNLLTDYIEEELEHPVLGVNSGGAMISKIKESSSRINLVLMNPELPDLQGRHLETIRAIRREHSMQLLPIILIEEERKADQIAEALTAGCNDCITLPLRIPLVKARIRNQLQLQEIFRKQSATPQPPAAKESKPSPQPMPTSDLSPPPARQIESETRPATPTIQKAMSLKEWIRHMGNAAEDACVAVLREMALALAYAHQEKFVHREITSDSVTVFPDGSVYINGVGVGTEITAQGLRPDPVITNPIRGMPSTPIYASPEQLLGKETDKRADIYIFGNLAYEVLSGRPPFYGESLQAIVDKQLKSVPPSLIKKRVDINLALEALVFKCINKEPSKRFQTAKDLANTLNRLYKEDYLNISAEFSDPQEPSGDATKPSPAEHLSEIIGDMDRDPKTLDRLVQFVEQIIPAQSKDQAIALKNTLVSPEVMQTLMRHNLTRNNAPLLYQLFKRLAYNKAVITLLNFFNRERDPFRKQALAEFAVLSAKDDLPALVIFGLELDDNEASVLLKAFGEVAEDEERPVFLRWAKHRGVKTQMELLRVISTVPRPTGEVKQILHLLARGGGTVHQQVQILAEQLLREHF